MQSGRLTGVRGLELFYQGWMPGGAPKGTVLVCHGYAEHGGRYAHLADYLTARGYAVWALDHRGHGRSEGVRAHVRRFDAYIEDFHTFAKSVERPGKTFIYAHSMGTLAALRFALRFSALAAGLVLSGAALAADEGVPPLLVTASKLLSVVWPRLPVLALDSADLSHDPDVCAAYDADPLVYRGKMRARLGAEIVRMAKALQADLHKLALPVLLMHGTADKLTAPAGSQMIYDTVSSEDKTLKWWEGMYHEVHNEPAVQEELFALVGDWLDARC